MDGKDREKVKEALTRAEVFVALPPQYRITTSNADLFENAKKYSPFCLLLFLQFIFIILFY